MSGLYGAHQLTDLTYTYQRPKPRQTVNPRNLEAAPNSIFGTLQRNSQFKYFSFILKNSGMDLPLSTCKGVFTIFAIPDEYIIKLYGEEFILNIDKFDALKIIRNLTIPNVITINDIKTEEISQLVNINNTDYLMARYSPETGEMTINNANVIDEKNCVNGNIIMIDKLELSYVQY